jgi:hypothetical protein
VSTGTSQEPVGKWDISLLQDDVSSTLTEGDIPGSGNVISTIFGEFIIASEQQMGKFEIRTSTQLEQRLKIIALKIVPINEKQALETRSSSSVRNMK